MFRFVELVGNLILTRSLFKVMQAHLLFILLLSIKSPLLLQNHYLLLFL